MARSTQFTALFTIVAAFAVPVLAADDNAKITAKIPADYKGKPAKAAVELPGTIKLTEFDSADGPNIAYSYGSAKPRVARFDKSHKTIKGEPEDVSQSYLGWTKQGEWVKISVHVKEAGTYVISGHFAAAGKDGKLSFSFNDITTGPVAIPTTAGYLPGVEVYHVWEKLDNLAEVTLPEGDYVFCCKIENDGGFNLESVTITKKPTTGKAAAEPTTTPKAAAKRSVPVTIGGKADPRAPGYIVLFENSVDAPTELARLETTYDFKNTHVYNMPGFKGFAGNVPAKSIEKMRWEPSIKSIEHDGVVSANGGGMGAN